MIDVSDICIHINQLLSDLRDVLVLLVLTLQHLVDLAIQGSLKLLLEIEPLLLVDGVSVGELVLKIRIEI